uniref:Uncharacterized protein n=1 Tax=Penaeus monodon majanivirus A TaxID=2984271 RepID=A0A9C7BGS7_9VIRU|nr:MAG: hypothetical protein [Penaeus monodon majanivirus A]
MLGICVLAVCVLISYLRKRFFLKSILTNFRDRVLVYSHNDDAGENADENADEKFSDASSDEHDDESGNDTADDLDGLSGASVDSGVGAVTTAAVISTVSPTENFNPVNFHNGNAGDNAGENGDVEFNDVSSDEHDDESGSDTAKEPDGIGKDVENFNPANFHNANGNAGENADENADENFSDVSSDEHDDESGNDTAKEPDGIGKDAEEFNPANFSNDNGNAGDENVDENFSDVSSDEHDDGSSIDTAEIDRILREIEKSKPVTNRSSVSRSNRERRTQSR